jgi:PrgI family protein
MRYEVPQFIDIEERIIGPLTIAQFFYLAGGVGGAYIAYRFLPGIINIVVAVAIAGFGAMLAFFKVNNRPFPVMLFAMVGYFISPRMYVWSFKRAMSPKPSSQPVIDERKDKKMFSEQKLKDLAWSLDVEEQ